MYVSRAIKNGLKTSGKIVILKNLNEYLLRPSHSSSINEL